MEINILNQKKHYLAKILVSCIFVLIACLAFTNKTNVVKAANQEDDFIYLSDIPYDTKQSSSAWREICLNKTIDGEQISVKVEGGVYPFEKGIWAHATSTVVFDISEYPDYNYFTAYIGLNSTAASSSNGVKFYIYTSEDGKTWDLKTEEEPEVSKPGENAKYVKIDIKGAKYIKLYANDNGGNGNDHSVYADPKLIKEEYNDNVVKSVAEYDEIIKTQYANRTLDDEEFELILLQREFVNNAGQFALKKFINENETEHRATLDWLMNDLNNLRLYIMGGAPDGNYYNSLKILTELLKNYKSDFDNTETTKYGTVLGDLYKRMAITLSLTHSTRVSLWMDPYEPENQSEAVTRYKIFKELHANNKFVVSDRQDHTGWFESLKIEEMRYVLNNIIDDEEILWLNEYTQKYIDANPNKEEEYLQPHHYMKYIWPDYDRPEYYAEENKAKWDAKYDFLRYNISYKPGVAKLWMNIEGGAVCGGISKIGSNIRGVHGTPSSVISQPGHAALIYYRKDDQGRGYWTIDNDVSGWPGSGKTERLSIRMPLGWGDEKWIVNNYDNVGLANYVLLAQGALNDYENYEKSREIYMLADVYKDDINKLYEIYEKSIEAEPINIDAWYGLIETYRKDETKTEKDFYELAERIFEDFKYYPLPMYHLGNEIEKELTSNEYKFKFSIEQTKALKEASVATQEESIQSFAVKQVANNLLGKIDTELAKFSFDGENKNKIILSERFDGTGIIWDYSIDGKETWNKVSFTADEAHEVTLTSTQVESINAENDIYVHIIGTSYDENNIYKIDIQEQKNLENLYGNDLENRVLGVNEKTEWRYLGETEWTSYETASPELTGNKKVEVRQSPSGTLLASEAVTFEFTEDNQEETRKYVPVSHLSIEGFSTETNGKNAIYSIDGNYNTIWHSDWYGRDTERYIIIKVDRPIYLSAVEFVPAGGGNGKILDGTVYGSMDGENWKELVKVENWANNEDTKSFEIEESQEVQYIKIVADRASNGNWFTARMFNIFQDLTKNPHPTAGIEYSTTNPTNKEVIVRLVNPSTDIIITNNDGLDTYTFTDNGTFTFEFIDKVTEKEGSAEARVTWIDKEKPTATIEYSTTKETTGEVDAKIIPSEKITITNNNGQENYTFTKNGEFTFKFVDEAGNEGTVTAKVSWIKEENHTPSLDEPNLQEHPISSKKYNIENDYISRITPGTTIKEFKQNVETTQEIIFKDEEGNELEENSVITTGTEIHINDLIYTSGVTGDIDGDGKITLLDLSKLQLYLVDYEKFNNEKCKAADIDNDNKVSLLDLSKVQLILVDLLTIE